MNTKLRARKFRIRRAQPLIIEGQAVAAAPVVADLTRTAPASRVAGQAPGRAAVATPPAPAAEDRPRRPTLVPPGPEPKPGETDDGFGDLRFSNAAEPESGVAGRSGGKTGAGPAIAAPQDIDSEAEEDAIRRENLTGRQLRLARRMAQKHGLPATSDFDAVRLLRRAGIDPFQRSNMLELVLPDAAPKGTAIQVSDPPVDTLPQTVRQTPLPSKELRPEGPRLHDIMAIQRDLSRRRRLRMLLLMARLAFFVGLPTLLAGLYFYTIATPLYATKSEFVIQKADGAAGGAMGGLLAGTPYATSTDSITVQNYLESRDAMLRLDADLKYKAHFSAPGIDALQRLETGATNEAAYRLYKRNVKIGFDPTEGIIRMEVIAVDPQVSMAFSKALIAYAEQQVDQLTARVRDDQMTGARESYDAAEQSMLAAQRRVVDFQQKYKVLSSEVEVSILTSQITALEGQLTQEKLRLDELLANPEPSAARVDPLRKRIAALEAEIATNRAKMTEDDASGQSLAGIQSELLAAQADVQTRQLMLSSALSAMETARSEANRQVRYLSIAVNPVAPDEPTYPRAFEDTFMAFMIFAGVYLMLSMTASILREQVSA